MVYSLRKRNQENAAREAAGECFWTQEFADSVFTQLDTLRSEFRSWEAFESGPLGRVSGHDRLPRWHLNGYPFWVILEQYSSTHRGL